MCNYRLKACRRCSGDLARDESDWICLQCGSYSYAGLYNEGNLPLATLVEWRVDPEPSDESLEAGQKGTAGCGRRDVTLSLPGLTLAGTAQSSLLLTGMKGLTWTPA